MKYFERNYIHTHTLWCCNHMLQRKAIQYLVWDRDVSHTRRSEDHLRFQRLGLGSSAHAVGQLASAPGCGLAQACAAFVQFEVQDDALIL